MNALGSNSNSASQTAHDAEATLRLIAGLPVPDGLEKRVIAGLRSAPHAGRMTSGLIISWPRLLNPTENWLRSAAAAAIVFVVIGGGWGVYSHVQSTSAVAVPPSSGATGRFSNAGAVRVPQTVPAPPVLEPAPVHPPVTETEAKPSTKATPVVHRNAKPAAASKHSAQVPASAAR